MSESAKGHAKNARNMIHSLLIQRRHDDEITEEELQYALDEVKAVLEEIE